MNPYTEPEILNLENLLEISHFRNASFTSRHFSCAVDCFLELTYRLFLPEILESTDFTDLSEFFNLLLIAGSTEIEFDPNDNFQNNAFKLLDEIRQPIWSKIIENCASFRNRNCDAQFSEIFSSNFF